MTNKELRLECLRLAQMANADRGQVNPLVARARSYADFVIGQSDAEIIGAARQFGEKIRSVG